MMWQKTVDALVPKHSSGGSTSSRKGIFAKRATTKDAVSNIHRATISSQTKLPSLTGRKPRSDYRTDDDERDAIEAVPKQLHTSRTPNAACSNYANKCFQECPLFAGRDSTFVDRLLQEQQFEFFMEGEEIVKQGEDGDTMYFLHRGEVDVFMNGAWVKRFKDGSIFGELSMLGIARKRTATVQASTLCDCRAISHKSFQRSLRDFPKERAFFANFIAEKREQMAKVQRERKREERLMKDRAILEASCNTKRKSKGVCMADENLQSADTAVSSVDGSESIADASASSSDESDEEADMGHTFSALRGSLRKDTHVRDRRPTGCVALGRSLRKDAHVRDRSENQQTACSLDCKSRLEDNSNSTRQLPTSTNIFSSGRAHEGLPPAHLHKSYISECSSKENQNVSRDMASSPRASNQQNRKQVLKPLTPLEILRLNPCANPWTIPWTNPTDEKQPSSTTRADCSEVPMFDTDLLFKATRSYFSSAAVNSSR